MYIQKLKQMFQDVSVDKKVHLIPEHYHKDLMLYTNNQVMDYHTFLLGHQKSCASPLVFEVSYDEDTFIEQDNRAGLRMWISVGLPGKEAHKLELMLIAHFKDGKIEKLWELSFPDWSHIPELNNY
jgi:hypothetical protein